MNQEQQEGSQWYWFKHNLSKVVNGFAGRHKFAFIAIAVVSILLAFVLRALYHPAIMVLREYSFPILSSIIALSLIRLIFGKLGKVGKGFYSGLLLLICGLSLYETLTANIPVKLVIAEHVFLLVMTGIMFIILNTLRNTSWRKRIIIMALVGGVAYSAVYFNARPHQYLALYYRYNSLNIVELKQDPETANERIQPLMMVYRKGQNKVEEAEHLATPDFVRIGDEFRFTMSIEPKYQLGRMTGEITQLFNVSGTSSAPIFTSREKVRFNVGENLLLANNSYSNACKAMGLFRYFNYQPMDVKYVKNDSGEWVQIITLLRWRGLIFPYTEFGGVHVINQATGEESILDVASRVLIGSGEWISPKDLDIHAYLKGQNNISNKVTRYIANSFRFQNGFLSPMPGYHIGDIRIPDLPGDLNDQPFTTYWDMKDERASDGLYHYFAMEPYATDKSGMNTSIFIPADGSPTVYIIKHKESGLTGVSSIAGLVRDSEKKIDWATNRPVEQRPWWKIIDGKVRKFWLTTVVSVEKAKADSDSINTSESAINQRTSLTEQFASSGIPELALTDASSEKVIWLDPNRQETWVEEVKLIMKDIWNQK